MRLAVAFLTNIHSKSRKTIISKNAKKFRKYWQLVTNYYQFKKGGVHFVLPLYKKKEALSGFLEVGVLLAEDVGDPEAADVMAQSLGTDQS